MDEIARSTLAVACLVQPLLLVSGSFPGSELCACVSPCVSPCVCEAVCQVARCVGAAVCCSPLWEGIAEALLPSWSLCPPLFVCLNSLSNFVSRDLVRGR
eukprot:Gregarina_sp_Pseudo_9__671@NODE_1427_length_1612_cov_10_594406_g1325_i0_p4_GENE_NODE_1427_length_1612_cov_10_594406_g1325_i0NODE_1427_length_1612_cov_10_594406_g1325_i0_p4_ORF_typecomplete_len100_score11_76_NODE_1427_length_1612_cov_10_594406_g1325_i0131430